MKRKMISLVLVLVAAVGVTIVLAGRAKEQAQAQAPASAAAHAALPHGVKVVAVDVLAKDPKSHAGKIAIEGVVSTVNAERGAILIIDKKEVALCGTTTCAEYSVPVMVPKDEFKGEFPKVKDAVVAVGELKPEGKGYRFTVQEVQKDGKGILTRTKAATGLAVANLLPATLLVNKDALALTETQVTKLKELNETFQQSRQPIQDKLTHCQAELVELLEKTPVDKGKVDHEKEEVEEYKAKIGELEKKAEESARAILTPEQLKKIG